MKIAMLPNTGLGDGIIQLLLAQNLAKLNFSVDFYHPLLNDMNQIIDDVNVCSADMFALIEKVNNYDVILADIAVDLSQFKHLFKHKLANYSMGRIAWYSILKRLRLRNPDFAAPIYILNGQDIDLNCFDGRTINSGSRLLGLSTADHIVEFFQKNNLSTTPNHQLSLSLPDDWKRAKYPQRVLIHPTSTLEKKNWLPERFVELANRLKNDGYEPVFSVSPQEKAQWNTIVDGKFDLPCFENIRDLAQYYYESSLLIGNDSGNGHLASALGLPTITLIGRKFRRFTWRPNWSQNIVVKPLISSKIVGDHYWKYTLSLRQVLNAFNQIQFD